MSVRCPATAPLIRLPCRGQAQPRAIENASAPSCGDSAASDTRLGCIQVATRREAAVLLSAALTLSARPGPAQAGKSRGNSSDWSSPGLAAPEDEAAPKFFKTQSGVAVQELLEGSGLEAELGNQVLVDFVLRRSNGYFIYGTVEGASFQPRDVPTGPIALTLGNKSVVAGLEDGLLGMRAGGKRRVLVPPELGYGGSAGEPHMPTFATQRQLNNHSKEPLLFEIELLRVNK